MASVFAATTAFAASARVTLSPTSGPAGSSTSVSGSAFPKNAKVAVTAAGVTTYGTTTSRGTFTISVTVPAAATGTVAVTAKALTVSASAPFVVTTTTGSATPTARSTATATATPLPVAPAIGFGVTTPGGPSAAAELDQVTAAAGRAPGIVMSYASFGQSLDVAGLNAVAARGAIPQITWEPWTPGAGVVQPAFALSQITAGAHDAYVAQWAVALRTWNKPVQLRFAHEMNGNWYPWSEGVNGNVAGDYVRAWRHVHDIFLANGATNVQWIWSPNVVYSGSVPLAGLYPGAAYVDIVAADGYNFGTSQTWSGWVAPGALFDPTFAEFRAIAPGKPLMIAETASSELGGSKAEWVTALFAWMRNQPDLGSFVWFNHLKETDWRLDSSASAGTAFANGLATLR